MKIFKRQQHRLITQALRLMNHDFLLRNKCWFGGGTAIVLKLDEYRQSLDLDFLCSDENGYRELRVAAVENGVRAFFAEPVESLRDFRVDQYGLRTVVELEGQAIRFEVVREARISVDGIFDRDLGVPTLTLSDMFAEKLLANADRCYDRAVSYRDAIDLGMLVRNFGTIPDEAIVKALKAYGHDIDRKLAWVVNRLQDRAELAQAAVTLQMDVDDAVGAISHLRREGHRLWPDAGIQVNGNGVPT